MKYQITPTERGVFLKIWEPAPITETRHKPYEILIQRWLSSESEAIQAIEEYVAMQADANLHVQSHDDSRKDLRPNPMYGLVGYSSKI